MENNQHKQPGRPGARQRIPLPGQRILRSVLAIWCCVILYFLRGQRGMPFFSIIAALQCIQPYTENALKVGKNRIRGTLVGTFWGTIVLFGELCTVGRNVDDTLFHYLLLGLFSGVVLYSTVLLKITDSSYFSTVVFLSICMNHLGDENPWIYIFNRTLDTSIGVGVGLLICALHLPRLRNRDILFVSGIDHVLLRPDRQLTAFTKVELNRFLKDGMKFTVSTKQTPATVRELLRGVDLKLPIIAMDGAVLYDLNTRRYLVTKKMDDSLSSLLTDYLHRQHMPFFVNTIEDSLLVIYYRSYKDQLLREAADSQAYESGSGEDGGFAVSRSALAAMHRLYLKKNVSPYRNYLRTDHDVKENVLYFLLIDKEEHIDRLFEDLRREPWFCRCRADTDTFDCEEGEEILRIYPADANRTAMLENLREYVGTAKTVTFGKIPGSCDVVIPDTVENATVKELKKLFEPVSLRGWKNMLRL